MWTLPGGDEIVARLVDAPHPLDSEQGAIQACVDVPHAWLRTVVDLVYPLDDSDGPQMLLPRIGSLYRPSMRPLSYPEAPTTSARVCPIFNAAGSVHGRFDAFNLIAEEAGQAPHVDDTRQDSTGDLQWLAVKVRS